MARVHLFTPSSSNEKRRHSPENNIAEDAPVPSLVEEHENKTISVSSQPIEEQQQPNLDVDTSSPTTSHLFMTAPSSPEQQQHDTNELSTSSAALTAALLQNAHGSNDMVGAVAAALSVKTDTFNVNNNNTEDKSDNAQPQNSDTMETRKPEDALDQATVAATALQLLGLSHTENKEKQNESSDNQATDDSNNENMLVANYQGIPSHLEDIDLASEEMIQDYKRGTWTREEDELLLAGIKKYGYGRWKEIATSIPGRKGKQLKQRWDNTLASKYVDQEWIRNKIRTEEALQQQQQQASSSTIINDDKTLKFLENTDWNDIAMKITEKAREGDQHAIEALLSQALLGTVASHAAAAAANTSQQTDTPTATASANNSTTASPIQTNNTAIHHDSNPSTPTTSTSNQTNETMNLNFSRSALDSNNPTPLNYADAAALALYASHLSQQATNNNGESSSNALNPYFLPFGNTNNDSNAVAAAAAAAVAAVAQQQQQNKDNDSNNESGSPKLANRSAASIGHKRRRSDPALAETQSAAMSIYASSTPITTTINNQTQTVYPCLFPNCGKTFARLYNLKSHSRTHTDDRPFVCQSCNAAFSRNHDLKRHSKIHGGAKPYKCEGCQKSFSRLDALKRHKSNQRNKGSCTQD